MNNSHIIIILIIIIVTIFLRNYDVYVVSKNIPLVDISNLVPKEDIKKDITEKFEDNILDDLKISDKQKQVISNTLEIINKMDTDLSIEDIEKILLFINNAYLSTSDYNSFYETIINDPKITEYPYNSRYTFMVVNLINKFDTDVNKPVKQKKKKVSFDNQPIVKYIPRQEQQMTYIPQPEQQIMASNQQDPNFIGQFSNYSLF